MTGLRPPTGSVARRYEIPTHLDVEDHLLLGLPARRTLALLCGLALAFNLWQQWPEVSEALRVVLAGVCVLVSVVGAFVRPGGLGLEAWGLLFLRHFTRRRVSTWCPVAPSTPDRPLPPGDRSSAAWEELAPCLDWAVGDDAGDRTGLLEETVREARPWAS